MSIDAKTGGAHDSVVVNRLIGKVIDPRKHWWADHWGEVKKGENRNITGKEDNIIVFLGNSIFKKKKIYIN